MAVRSRDQESQSRSSRLFGARGRIRYPETKLNFGLRMDFRFWLGTRRAGEVPGSMAVESVGKKLEGPTADGALEIVLHGFGRPLRLEEILQRARALGGNEDTIIHQAKEAIREFEILARFVDRAAREKLGTPWAGWHWTSVPPVARGGMGAESAGVMVALWG